MWRLHQQKGEKAVREGSEERGKDKSRKIHGEDAAEGGGFSIFRGILSGTESEGVPGLP